MRSERLLNSLTLVFMTLTGIIAAYYVLTFIWPTNPLNPFAPPDQQLVLIVTPTPQGTPTFTPPPTWTITPTAPTPTTRPTSTTRPTITPRPTRTPLPTETETPTETPTATEDICSSLELLGPPPGQKFFQYDIVSLTWKFGRPLEPNEHFDVLLDPPGAGQGSIAWADKSNPANKNCGAFCEYQTGLNGIYSGGRFMWTIAIVRANANDQVTGTVCPAPEPFFFTWP